MSAAQPPRPLQGRVEAYEDPRALARAAADGFARAAAAAVEAGRRFNVALTGGDSPRGLFRELADPDRSSRIPWAYVHLFWGDDRCVPPAHPRSNFGMANRLFISHVPIPPENVHRIRGELPPGEAAREYAAELERHFEGAPRFDLVHLGLGDDGHVASLFPFDLPRLTARRANVLTSLRMPRGEPRVTLSMPVLNAATRVEFLLPGASEKPIARTAMAGPLDPFRIPAQLIRPAGELVWLHAP